MTESGDDEEGGVSVLDENGNLFGLVNIVDLLVVLLVIAVAVSGVALVFSGSNGEAEPDEDSTDGTDDSPTEESDTRYATLELGEYPEYIAEEISVGDTAQSNRSGELITVTDVYRYDGSDGISVVVRAEITGTSVAEDDADEPRFEFQGERLRRGQELTIDTDEYDVAGAIIQIEQSGEELPTQDSELLVSTTVSDGTADEVSLGDEYTVAGDTLGEITAVQRFPAASEREQSLVLGLSVQTLERSGTQQFGSTPAHVGTQIRFVSDGYELSPEIINRTASTLDSAKRPFVIETTVPADVAGDIAVGDEYRLGGEPVVTVESKESYVTDESEMRRVILGVSVVTHEVGGSVLFGDRTLRLGQSVPIETGEYDIEGEIVRRGSLVQAGEETTRSVSLTVENIRSDRADSLSVGQTEEGDGQVTAEILGLETAPAEVVLESDDGDIHLREHPRNLDVDIDAELTVRELDDGSLRFRGESLRTGETVTLEFGQLRVTAQVSSIGE